MHIIHKLAERDKEASKILSESLHISNFLSVLLVTRGILNEQETIAFLNPQLSDLIDPFIMKDMDKAVERIIQALSVGEKILVYGDEDVDGMCSTVLLVDILKDLGGKVSYIIPNKAKDGIGLKEKFIDQAKENEFRLIITVDCGISNFSQVDYAQSRGIDVVITDHHETLNELPKAIAIVDPKRKDDPYPFKWLSGAGVAYKVGQAIAMKKLNLSCDQWISVKRNLLSYVMLGTIGDRVPLVKENRIFVRYGLEELTKSKRSSWVAAICKNSRLEIKPFSISTILNNFIPLLSAGESVDGKNISCELLLSKNYQKAEEWASELYFASRDWLYRARTTYSRMKSTISVSNQSNVVIVVDKEASVDVLSYCTSKLKDGFNKPVIVLGFKDDHIIGEARAPKGFNLMVCFEKCSEYFLDYGGHKCAAGFSSKIEDLAQIRKKLVEVAETVFKEQSASNQPNLKVEITLDELNSQLISEVIRLAPFGEGNPTPTFLCNQVYIQRIRSGFHAPVHNIIFWATRKIRHNWVFPYGHPVKVNLSFIIDGNGKLFITDFEPVESRFSRSFS